MKYFITCLSGYEREAVKELEAVGFKARILFMRGLLFAKSKEYNPSLLRNLSFNYVCKIYPIYKVKRAELGEIIRFFKEHVYRFKDKRFAVRCKRRGLHEFSSSEVERSVGKVLAEFGKVDLENPEIIALVQIVQSLAFLSILKQSDIFVYRCSTKKKWNKRPLNRSELKLLEVYEIFPEIFSSLKNVLDIGSAPGGWARILSKHAKRVFALDPADLKVHADNIVHIRAKAEDFDSLNVKLKFDLITNDMNKFYNESLDIAFNIAEKYLKSNGYLIQTLKHYKKMDAKNVAEYVKKIAGNKYEILFIGRLRNNSKNELTLVARKIG